MALASRSSRRGGGRRWIIVGLVLTACVLLLDASIKSRSQAPVRTLAGQAWVDRVLPMIEQSNVASHQLAGVRTSAATSVTAPALDADLTAVVGSTSATYRAYEALRPPTDLDDPAGLLQACLAVRAQASASMAAALRAQLSGPSDPTVTSRQAGRIAAAAEQLQVADQAYDLFAQHLPASLGVAAPASVWIPDPGLYSTESLQVWLASLRARVSLTPLHRVAIIAVSTDPGPVSHRGALQILAPSKQLLVTVVVGDTGNQPEDNLTLTATVSASVGTASVRDFLSLTPGGAETVDFSALDPPPGVAVTLTVTLTPPAGSPTPAASTTLPVELYSTTAPVATTTTTAPTPSTTTPGSVPTSATSAGATTTTVPAPTTTAYPTNSVPATTTTTGG